MVTGVSNMVQPANTSNANLNTGGDGLQIQSPTVKKPSDNRRSNKPIMEKRRRARINNCLNELKTLILDAMKKDPARHSKLEKADILEMTVKHLQNLQRQQLAMSAATDPTIINKFRAGFSECAGEVGRFPGLDPTVRRRLLQHLANCLNQNKNNANATEIVQVHILPNGSVVEQINGNSTATITTNNGNNMSSSTSTTGAVILSNGNGNGVQLLPTRLPNGDIALVLPNQNSNPATLPLLVPIPQRTSSTASCSSSSSNYSLSISPEPMDTQCYQPKPLSLVMKKIENQQNIEEKPWRPW